MNPNSFQARYCARWGIDPSRFRTELRKRALYPHARPWVALLGWMDSQHAQADFEFVDDVAHLESVAGFRDALDSYAGHFSNYGFLRRRLRLRISARRMWRLVRETLPGAATGMDEAIDGPHSVTPFDRRSAGGKSDRT